MSTTRMMTGVGYDLTGQTVNNLVVQQMTRRHPQPAYEVKCRLCGSISTQTHRDLQNGTASCPNYFSHGRQQAADSQRETLTQFHKREVAKQNQHTAHLENELQSTAIALAKMERTNLLTLPDPSFWLDPETQGYCEEFYYLGDAFAAEAFNQHALDQFLEQCPSYLPTAENAAQIAAYLERNDGLKFGILTTATIARAYHRLDRYGVLERRSDREPAPQPVPQTPQVRTAPAAPSKTTVTGRDLNTGEDREFSAYEVNRMSADEFKRTFKLTKSKLALPNRGPDHRLPR